jgi:hypothetical protein
MLDNFISWSKKILTREKYTRRVAIAIFWLTFYLNGESVRCTPTPFHSSSVRSSWEGRYHRVGRVLSFLSSRWNWDSPNPSPARECAPHPFSSGGRGTLAGERGGGRVPIHSPPFHLCPYVYSVNIHNRHLANFSRFWIFVENVRH